MLNSRPYSFKTVLYLIFSTGILLTLFISSSSFAVPPPDSSEQSVPVQLRIIRDTLAEMEARLATQLDDIQTGVTANSTALSTHDSAMHERLDMVDSDNESNSIALADLSAQLDDRFFELLESVNSVEVTTQVCMSAEFAAEIGIGEHGEAGVGWPNVLDAKLIIQEDAALKVGSGLGQELCIQIPLYSVFVEGQLVISQDAADQLDELIELVSQPALNAVTLAAEVYYQTVPSPSAVLGVFDELINAALFGDPKIIIDPATYEPLIPPLMASAIAAAPDIVEGVINDPCGTLHQLDVLHLTTADEFNAVCGIAVDASLVVLNTIDDIVKTGMCIISFGAYCP